MNPLLGVLPQSWEDFISHQLIPCPPLETQQKNVESIETTTGKIDATLAKIMQEIELLKEYRVALISEVVTGKVSVISE
jgi:type I restriction enzyme, S subunit